MNYEDVDPLILDQRMWFPARPDFKVVVRRSTLNVVASRMKRAEKRPSSRSFLIDEPFLESMMKFRSETPGWVLIDFDLWLRNEDGYRAKIADRL
ncbi:MAG: hypothetical protein ACO3QV_08070, partial [Candidatus Nanopelagicaceae bacterium]